VTVTPTTYVYRGGEEAGLIVGAINYARFPAPLARAEATMRFLADRLMVDLYQQSYTITTPEKSIWVSRRDADMQK
jgi:hypothetical protein